MDGTYLAISDEEYCELMEIAEKYKNERKKGYWKPCKASIYPYGNDVKCSVCGHRMGSSFGYIYCPMCGARMEE